VEISVAQVAGIGPLPMRVYTGCQSEYGANEYNMTYQHVVETPNLIRDGDDASDKILDLVFKLRTPSAKSQEH
jgi:hypothetical protein